MRARSGSTWWLIGALRMGLAVLHCDRPQRTLRGWYEPSRDGATFLVVDEAAQGCALMVDGRTWGRGLHAAGRVTPGEHALMCGPWDAGATYPFEVRSGSVFHFDYWGP